MKMTKSMKWILNIVLWAVIIVTMGIPFFEGVREGIEPPIALRFRKSMLGSSWVLVVANCSTEKLLTVRIVRLNDAYESGMYFLKAQAEQEFGIFQIEKNFVAGDKGYVMVDGYAQVLWFMMTDGGGFEYGFRHKSKSGNTIEADKIMVMPNAKLHCKSVNGNELTDVLIIDTSNPKVKRTITAERAIARIVNDDLELDLRNLTVDPIDEKTKKMGKAKNYLYKIERGGRFVSLNE